MNELLRTVWHMVRRRHPWRFVPGYEQQRVSQPALLVCDTCGIVRSVALAPGHPESLTAELPAEQEALLAEIEATLWPEESDVDRCRDVLERIFPLDWLRPGEA